MQRLADQVELGQQPREVGREAAERGQYALGPNRVRIGAQRLDERLVRHREAFVTAPIEHDRPLAVCGAGELASEPGLTDARLPRDDHGARSLRLVAPQRVQTGELSIAADERELRRYLKHAR